MLIDAHTHQADSDIGVISVEPDRFDPRPGLYYSVGIHPWSTSTVCDDDFRLLEAAARHPQVVALGMRHRPLARSRRRASAHHLRAPHSPIGTAPQAVDSPRSESLRHRSGVARTTPPRVSLDAPRRTIRRSSSGTIHSPRHIPRFRRKSQRTDTPIRAAPTHTTRNRRHTVANRRTSPRADGRAQSLRISRKSLTPGL